MSMALEKAVAPEPSETEAVKLDTQGHNCSASEPEPHLIIYDLLRYAPLCSVLSPVRPLEPTIFVRKS